jgi:hypothetical protein
MKKLFAILFFLTAGPLDMTGAVYTFAQAQTHTIKGNVGAATVVLSWTDTTAKTLSVAGNGDYTIVVSPSWSGTITPSKTGVTFSPANRTYTIVTTNQNSQNFTQTAITYLISGNAGTNGVTLSYNDGGAKTATSGTGGSYSFSVSYNWSGTVMPSKTGFTFTPVNTVYTHVLANQTAQNYTAIPITFTISGNAGAAGATISWTDGGAKTVTADGTGNYSIVVSYSFDGDVTPSKTGYTFTPSHITYTNVLADQTNKNYSAARITYTISGDAGTAGVLLSWTDTTAKTLVAGTNGNYSIIVSYGWSGTITPSRTGHTYSPLSRTYTNVLANVNNQNYTESAGSTIYGNAGAAAVILSYTDGTAKTATADGSGNYSLIVSLNWSGTVTPSKTGFTFLPTNIAYTNVNSDQGSQNYTAIPVTFMISGNAGIGGATLSWTDTTAKTTIADGSGNYVLIVSYSYDGTVTPSRAGFTFTPSHRHYSNVTSNQPNQNYTTVPVTFTISGRVGRSGVVLNWVDTTAKTDTSTGTHGDYSFEVSYGWTGTVTPLLSGVTFDPPVRSYSNVLSDKNNQDYNDANGWTISGNAGVAGASMSWSDVIAKTAVADGTGAYSITVTNHWTGTVTPSLTGYTFSPVNIAYTSVSANQTNKNYIATPFVVVDLKAFLTGPFTGGVMTTGLNTAGLIPVSSENSYAAATYVYTAKIVPSIPNAHIIDWVLVELRTGTTGATKVAIQAAFMKNDGTVVDFDGTSALTFSGTPHGSYYIVVRHRNHLPVMSAGVVVLSGPSVQYDFTTGQSQAYGTNAMFALTGGVFGMVAGDVNRDGSVKFTGSGSDRGAILDVVGFVDSSIPVNGYNDADINMDGAVKFTGSHSDRGVILDTVGFIDPSIPVPSQVPN